MSCFLVRSVKFNKGCLSQHAQTHPAPPVFPRIQDGKELNFSTILYQGIKQSHTVSTNPREVRPNQQYLQLAHMGNDPYAFICFSGTSQSTCSNPCYFGLAHALIGMLWSCPAAFTAVSSFLYPHTPSSISALIQLPSHTHRDLPLHISPARNIPC